MTLHSNGHACIYSLNDFDSNFKFYIGIILVADVCHRGRLLDCERLQMTGGACSASLVAAVSADVVAQQGRACLEKWECLHRLRPPASLHPLHVSQPLSSSGLCACLLSSCAHY